MPILIVPDDNKSTYGNPKITSSNLGEAKDNIGHYYCEDFQIKTPIKTNG
jgi:hypothetical protein